MSGSAFPPGGQRQSGSPDRLTVTVKEAAARLGIGRDAAYDLVRRGALPSIRIGRRILIPTDALQAWVRSAAGQGNDDDG